MKKIIINGSHVEKLTAELDTIQHRCTARTLTAEYIEYILDCADNEIKLPKKAMAGTKLTYTGAEKFPRAYKHIPESTHFTAEHNGRFWVITEITRDKCPNRHDNTSIELSETAKAAMLSRFASIQLW